MSSEARLDCTESEEAVNISILAISDTHSMQSKLHLDSISADIFIHTGDLTNRGTTQQLDTFITWLSHLPFQHKVIIAGNHDIGLDKECTYRSARAQGPYPTPSETDEFIALMKSHNIIYLSPEQPSTQIFIKGCKLRIYGLPYSPNFLGPNAFMRNRKEDTWGTLKEENSYDILLSHSPPKGLLDKTVRGDNVGCDHFLSALERVKPLAAVCGHIHEARGMEMIVWENGKTTELYNAAVMNRDGTISEPTTFTITLPKMKS
jgi:Calcineurin-like phosphoesterase